MARKRKQDEDEDFVVDDDEESDDDESSLSSSGLSSDEEESEDEAPRRRRRPQAPKPAAPAKAVRSSARRPAPEVVQRKEAKSKALQRLKSARNAAPAKQPARRRAELEDSSSGSEDDAPDDNEAESDSPSPSPAPPPSRRRPAGSGAAARALRSRGGPKPSQLVTGHRDYASDRSGGASDGLSDFIASEEEESDSGHIGAQEEERKGRKDEQAQGSGGSGSGSKRKAEREEEDEEEEEEGLTVPSAVRQRRRGGGVPVVIDSSSEESEEDDDVVLEAAARAAAAGGAAPGSGGAGGTKRRRLRKKGEADAAARSPAAGAVDDEREVVDLTGEDEGDGDGVALRARPARPRLTAAQRIQAQQAEFLTQQEQQDAGEGEEEEPRELTDEGEPSSSSGGGVVEEEEEQEDGGGLAGALRATERSPGWQRAVEAIGIGARSDRECFKDYLEYLTLCHVDPTYRSRILDSPQHRAHYQRSVKRVEASMTAARDAVHSEAWRSCAPGLLEAVEWLPGATSGWDPDNPTAEAGEDAWEEWSERCDACNRRNSHATRLIRFKGVPRPPPQDESWEDVVANRRLSDAYMQVSPVYQRNRGRVAGGRRGFQMGFTREEEDAAVQGGSDSESQDSLHRFIQRHHGTGVWRGKRGSGSSSDEEEEEEGDEAKAAPGHMERRFRVGRHCSARLMLYHGMFHWKHRLLARIRAELKRELTERWVAGRPTDRGAVADGMLANEALEAALWSNFRSMLDMGRDYQLGGGGEGGRWRTGVDPHQRLIDMLASLHADSDGEESEVDWGDDDESEGDEEEQEEEAADGDEEEEGVTPAKDRGGAGPSQAAGEAPAQDRPSLAPANPTPPSATRDRRLSSGGLRQVDIRNIFGSQGSQGQGKERGDDDGVRRRL